MNESELKILDELIEECDAVEKLWKGKIDEYIDNGGKCTYKNKEYLGLIRCFNQARARTLVLLEFADRVAHIEEEEEGEEE